MSFYHLSFKQFFDQISYMKFGYIGLCLNEYQNLTLVCVRSVCAKAPVLNAIGIMKSYGYDRYNIQYCAGCMIVYIAVCRVTSYLALRFIKM